MLEGANKLPNGGIGGFQTIAKVPATPVFLFGKGSDLDGVVVEADLHDHLYRQTRDGKTKAGVVVPPDIEILCPRCSEWLHVDGHKKTIRVHYLHKPQMFAHPLSGELCVQSVIVSIDNVLRCPQPQGKSICGLQFRLTENILHRI
jgi:hypothetical protein